MTLGELKAELKALNIVAVGSLKNSSQPVGKNVTVLFSEEGNVVWPFKPDKAIIPLVTATGKDNEKIHPEKIKALKRRLIPGWDEE
jgi:hypothetical protein